MEILCSNFKLRAWRMEDKPSLVKNANNENVASRLRDQFPHPYTLEDAEEWVEIAHANKRTEFAIEVDGKAVGGIGFRFGTDIYKRSAEIGYWLGEDYWGRGIISEAVQKVTDYAFDNFRVNRIFAGVFENNPASARVLEKAGFQYEGTHRKNITKNGRTFDELMYAIVR